MGQGAVDEVGENGLDHGVFAVGDVGIGNRLLRVGQEGVVTPEREQRVGVSGVFHPPYDQPGGDAVLGGSESGVRGFGYLGVGDPLACVGVADRPGIAHRGPRVIGN